MDKLSDLLKEMVRFVKELILIRYLKRVLRSFVSFMERKDILILRWVRFLREAKLIMRVLREGSKFSLLGT